jgi:acyl-CoA synthetase (NDP forming)
MPANPVYSRAAKMGVSAIVGLGNKSDLDEDDPLTFFEQDEHTKIIAQHFEDFKDGRAFAEVARRVSRKKPIVVLKAGRTAAGARAAHAHTGAIAGKDKIYEDILRQSGVIRARSLRELLEFARHTDTPDSHRQQRVNHHCGRSRRETRRSTGRQTKAAHVWLAVTGCLTGSGSRRMSCFSR